MSITREQVADLWEGDVVELSWPSTSDHQVTMTARGALRTISGETAALFLGAYCVRDERHNLIYGDRRTLTVVSRAPRPLYVNHPRTEPVAGDVVRDADSGHNGVWFCSTPGTNRPWIGSDDGDYRRDALPDRLRLLVDGETGQVVQ